jgi:hypothetical protein
MSTKDNEVNRRIDGETAEGHHVRRIDEADETIKRASLDDDAEGHKRTSLIGEDAEAKRTSKRHASLDDEAEGHRVRD